jgi:hypothetical protein
MPLPDDWLQSAPAPADLTIVRGRTVLARYRLLVAATGGSVTLPNVSGAFNAVDLSACTLTAQVRSIHDNELLLTLTATGDADGNVRISATPAETAALAEPEAPDVAMGNWDLTVLDESGNKLTPLRGRVRLLDDYTQ